MGSAGEEHSYTCIYSQCGLVFCNVIVCSAVSQKSSKMKPRLTIFTMLTLICVIIHKPWDVITIGEVELRAASNIVQKFKVDKNFLMFWKKVSPRLLAVIVILNSVWIEKLQETPGLYTVC